MKIELLYDLLTNEELEYIHDLINDKTKWENRTSFDEKKNKGEKLWYDSIWIDDDKLKNYYKIITFDGKYEIVETAINIVKHNRMDKKNRHVDNSDLSYVTYLNNEYVGGRFFYYDKDDNKNIIEPKIGLTVKINSGVPHEVEEVTDGVRYSLYSFLRLPRKEEKSLI